MIIGIDLGTTNSVAATMSATGPELIPNALGEFLTPSAVAVDQNGDVLVGNAAKEYQVLHPHRSASLFKRYMGADHTLQVADRRFTAEQLSSIVLKSLKSDAEAFLNQPVTEAVITVPAYFNDNQRKATIAAGQMAGFEVRRILNEPTAAAMAYGLHESQDDRILIVLDLGGGTFDVSIVEVFDGALEVKASSGECFLGGEDFTVALATHLFAQRGMHYDRVEKEHPLMVARLLHQCEQVKQKLSRADVATLRWPSQTGEFSEFSETMDIDRATFNLASAKILERIDLPIRRALNDARLTRDQLHQVLLIGGATRMPCFREYVEQVFRRAAKAHINPDEAVAIGAAVQAGLLANDAAVADLVVTDVCPFTLGIEVSRRLGRDHVDEYYLPIIDRNTTIPASRVKSVMTIKEGQHTVSFRIYQGEARKVTGNLLIGQFEAQGIPFGPAGQELEIRFTYDLNGVLEAEATILATGRKVSHVLTRYAKGLSQEQIDLAVKQLQSLKMHPREQAANQNLLRRAERMYAEVAPRLRDQLDVLIDQFEAALLSQDEKLVEQTRTNLESLLRLIEAD